MVSDTIPNITRHFSKSADEIPCTFQGQITELILGLRLANERRRNDVSHWLGANLESALYCM